MHQILPVVLLLGSAKFPIMTLTLFHRLTVGDINLKATAMPIKDYKKEKCNQANLDVNNTGFNVKTAFLCLARHMHHSVKLKRSTVGARRKTHYYKPLPSDLAKHNSKPFSYHNLMSFTTTEKQMKYIDNEEFADMLTINVSSSWC